MLAAVLALATLPTDGGPPAAAAGTVALARVATREPVVALTFDACATRAQANGFDREVFEILRREQIPATVFLGGRWIEAHPAEARALADEPGIEIGNHSYSHRRLPELGPRGLAREIDRTEALIAGLGRRSVAFRPPAGLFDRRTVRLAAERSLPTVLWDVVSGDAGGHLRARRIVATVARRVRPGSIVVFHINGRGPHTKRALPEIIRALRDRGFRFAPLSELFALPDGAPVRAPRPARRAPAAEGSRAPTAG